MINMHSKIVARKDDLCKKGGWEFNVVTGYLMGRGNIYFSYLQITEDTMIKSRNGSNKSKQLSKTRNYKVLETCSAVLMVK